MDDTDLGMKLASFLDDLPEHSILASESTEFGWRGLTEVGEVLNVRSQSHVVPEEVLMMSGSTVTGRGKVDQSAARIDAYLEHHNRASILTSMNFHEAALQEEDAALAIAPTLYARFNRSMILLSLGRWREGFEEYWACECEYPFLRPQVRQCFERGLQPWRGECLSGKSILVIHAHGFGDSIMALRYVPRLRAMGADVMLVMPDQLLRLASQLAYVVEDIPRARADYFCPALHLVGLMERAPDTVCGDPYLKVSPADVDRWRARLGDGVHVGVAWSPASQNAGDYPRKVELAKMVGVINPLAQIHSVQKQGADEARALGVQAHEFADFYDCAAAMLAMDRIVTIDTAAVHLAGAIGHPKVDVALGSWASWRWLAPWYGTRVSRLP